MKPFFDSTKRKTVIAVLGLGMSRRAAANCVGCHVMTIYNEETRNKKFAEDMAQAESGYELRHKQRIEKASEDPKHWRASAWSLERKLPNEYERRKPENVTRDQAERVLAQFVKVLAITIPDAKTRNAVFKELWKVIDASTPQRERKEIGHV